jgi:hypothetical protein
MGAPRIDTVHAVQQLLTTHPPAATHYVTVDAWAP